MAETLHALRKRHPFAIFSRPITEKGKHRMSASTPALTGADLVEMTLEGAAAALARGVTAEALAKAFLARVGAYNPRYNAIITMNPTALDDARAVDRRRAAGEA